MGLALCHRVPRDFVIELALWLMIIAFILQAVAIGSRNSITSVGYLSNKDTHPNQRVAWIAAHPALYSSGGNTIKICNPSESVIRYDCARFAETYHVVNGLILASFITNILVVIAGLLFFTAFSNTSTGMLRRLCVGVTIPTTLQCAVCGLFFARTIHYAKEDVSNFLINVPANVLAFHRRYAANLMIAATAFLCAADVLVAGRFFYALLIRWRVATSPAPDCTDVQEMMRLNLINDDWERQKQILRSHAKSVQLEICIKENNGGSGGGRQGSSTSIDSSAVHHAYSNLPYVVTRSNNEISENINNIGSNTNTNNNAIVNSDGLVGTDVHAQLPNNLPITSATQGNTIIGQEVDIVQNIDTSTRDRGKVVTSGNAALSCTGKNENQNYDVSNRNMTNTCQNLTNKEYSNVLTVEEGMGTNDVHLYSEESAHNSNNNNNDYNNNTNNTNSNSNNDDDDYYNGNNNRSINNIAHSGSAVHQVSSEHKMESAKRSHKHRSKSASDKKWDEVNEFSFRRQTSSFVLKSPSIVTLDGAGMRREVPPPAFVPTDANRSSQRVLLVTSAEMADSVFTNHNESN